MAKTNKDNRKFDNIFPTFLKNAPSGDNMIPLSILSGEKL